jgi:hypothetical protein
MTSRNKTIVLAGYLVRYPLGGYVWQVVHYLLGFRALGYEVWFYEDTQRYAPAYNPLTDEFGPTYEYGIAAAARFLEHLGLGACWGFIDSLRQRAYGPAARQLKRLIEGVMSAIVGQPRLRIAFAGAFAVCLEERVRTLLDVPCDVIRADEVEIHLAAS